MNKQQFIRECEALYDKLSASMLRGLQFADHNFRISNEGWKMIKVGNKSYLTNPEKDVWTILGGSGEQLFTWDAMMRETEKADKRVPTDEEFDILLRTKKNMPNLVFVGYRSACGAFGNFGSSSSFFWTSTPVQSSSTFAWTRLLSSSGSGVLRIQHQKTSGFSVRCLKD